MKYDVIIIGSGLGGLFCARQLAKSGRSVLLLERQSQPGGCLQSYQRGPLHIDTGLHYVGGLAGGQPLHAFFKQLGLLKLPWVRLDADGFDRVTIGRQTFPLAEGFSRFAATLTEYFPHERDGLRRYVSMLRHLPTFDEAAHVGAYDYLTSVFRDPLLINVLSASALKLELRRDTLPLFHFAHCMSSYIQSSWRLRGGGGVLVDSLVRDIKAFGGEVVCSAEVTGLREQGGRVVAARCHNGHSYEGSLFVSDVHPRLTFGWLKDSSLLRPVFCRRIQSLSNTFGIFTASLVLKPGTLAYFNHNKYVYKKGNVWSFADDIGGIGGVMVSCRVPEDGTSYTRQIDLLTPMPWSLCQPWENTTVGRRGEIYNLQKERLADDCIRLAERVIPGLYGMVERRYLSTPLTWRDYTLTPCGSAFGVRKDYHQPLLTAFSPRTPVPNLLLTGQSLMLHGVEGVAMTAQRTLAEILKSDSNS